MHFSCSLVIRSVETDVNNRWTGHQYECCSGCCLSALCMGTFIILLSNILLPLAADNRSSHHDGEFESCATCSQSSIRWWFKGGEEQLHHQLLRSSLPVSSRIPFQSSKPCLVLLNLSHPLHAFSRWRQDKINSVKLCHNKHFRGITVSKKKKNKKLGLQLMIILIIRRLFLRLIG